MVLKSLALLLLVGCATAYNQCAVTLCIQGTICKEINGQAHCLPSTPSPTPTPTTKPGRCPGYQARHFPTCRAQCRSDSSCSGSQKCCFSGCGMKCVYPQSTPTPTPTTKPGRCPGYQTRHFPTCRAQCTSDSSCFGNQKCCFSGCGFKCVSPQSTQPPNSKPGVCPYYNNQIRCFWSQNYCTSDYQCSSHYKCCRYACGTRCMSPYYN